MYKNRSEVGWLSITSGDPSYVNVDLGNTTRTFPANREGLIEARTSITSALGRDDWALQPMEIFGYRIIIPEGLPKSRRLS